MSKFPKRWVGIASTVAIVVVPLALHANAPHGGVAVRVQAAALHEVRPSILATGVLKYKDEVQLSPEVIAKVATIFVKEGQDVHAGDLLMRLDGQTYSNAIERDDSAVARNALNSERERVTLELKRAQYLRTKALFDAHMVNQSKLDDDKSAFEVAEVDYKASQEAVRGQRIELGDARHQLSKTEIRSPIAGRIVSIPVKAGEVAIPSTTGVPGANLAVIADTSSILAEIKVDEGDIGRVRMGQTVNVFAAAFSGRPIAGSVVDIALAPTIENQVRSYKVVVRLNAADLPQGIRSGMSCRAEVYDSDGHPRLTVPVGAIISADKDAGTKHSVVQVVNGVAHHTPVTTGLSDDTWVEVVDGLKAGDTLAVGPSKTLHGLRDGDAITPLSDATSKPTGSNAK